MFLQSIATAVPPGSFTQADCWEIIQQSPVKQRLDRRTQLFLRTILRGDSGVQTRHFAVPEIAGVFDLTADQ
ncbi:MAG: stilbene synthase, partial [Verrucomicrobia bacterium]|nr:stilbene synthase [Verrucomicrobiota bacterium]